MIINTNANKSAFVGKELRVRITRLIITPELILPIYKEALLIIQYKNVFII